MAKNKKQSSPREINPLYDGLENIKLIIEKYNGNKILLNDFNKYPILSQNLFRIYSRIYQIIIGFYRFRTYRIYLKHFRWNEYLDKYFYDLYLNKLGDLFNSAHVYEKKILKKTIKDSQLILHLFFDESELKKNPLPTQVNKLVIPIVKMNILNELSKPMAGYNQLLNLAELNDIIKLNEDVNYDKFSGGSEKYDKYEKAYKSKSYFYVEGAVKLIELSESEFMLDLIDVFKVVTGLPPEEKARHDKGHYDQKQFNKKIREVQGKMKRLKSSNKNWVLENLKNVNLESLV